MSSEKNRAQSPLGDRVRPKTAPMRPPVAFEATRKLAELRALAASWGIPLHTVADRVSLRLEEVAQVTGMSVSFVRALIRDGDLPAAKVRTLPLVLVADLLAFFEQRRSNPQAEADRLVTEIEESLRGMKE